MEPDMDIAAHGGDVSDGSSAGLLDRRFNRRDFGRFAAGAVAAGAIAGVAGAPSAGASTRAHAHRAARHESASLQLSWVPNPEFGSLYVAEKKGFWKKDGLDVTLIPGGPNVAQSAVVASGKALVGMASVTGVAQANITAGGTKFRIIGAEFQKSPYAIVSLPSKPLKKPADMKGTKIGVAAGDLTSFKAFLKISHIAESDVTIVPISFTSTPLTSGQVDGQVVFFTTQSVALQVAGKNPVTMLWADYNFNQYNHCYFVLNSTLHHKQSELVELMTGVLKGAELYVKHPEKVIKLSESFYQKSGVITAKGARLAGRKYAEIMVSHTTKKHGLLWMGEAHKNLHTMKAAGIDGVSPSIFTNEILKKVYKAL